ncbi:MAG: DNA primase [Candidatus Gracilibacteria bacterium]|nr:DNA primase [Candidatus Gracilibacteria bacterium]
MSLYDEIESKIDIVDLVGKYTKLKKNGANYKALCPFPGHNEKTPSFVVSPSKQIAYCFGCHRGGGAIKFIMDIENCTFKEALEILASQLGIKIDGINPEKEKIMKNIYSLFKDIGNYYANSLKKYPEIMDYLLKRGLTEESIEKFKLGYADSGLELYRYLKEKGYDDEAIEQTNVFLNIRDKKDKFIGRVIFPVKNIRGDTVAFAGRIIDSGEPKYLNSPASQIYDKSNILFALFERKSEITKKDFIIITEGYMDTISLHQAEIKNAVAVSGTALTDKHIDTIKRLTKKIYLCFDRDNAGKNATKLAIENLKNKEIELKIIKLENGKDPDEILKKGGDFEELIKKALSPISYYIKELKSDYNLNSIEEKRKFLKEILAILKSYTDNIEIDFYLKEIASEFDLDRKIVTDEFKNTKFPKQEYKEIYKKNDELTITAEDTAIGYILSDENLISLVKSKLIFIENISKNLSEILNNGKDFLNTLSLEEKEKYRGLELEIEKYIEGKTNERISSDLEKIIEKINKDTYKKIETELKQKMLTDPETFSEYSDFIQKAKQRGYKK